MTPELVVERLSPQIDEPVALRVAGVAPGQRVVVEASSVDARGVGHASWAEYEASPDAAVDPARQAPRAGTYEGVDAFGLWWSMASDPERPFARGLAPIPTIVSAAIGREVVARVALQRLRVASGVTVEPVREGGFVATLFLPASRPAPGLVVLGGSEGGLSLAEEQSALLSARGYVALALAYFGVEGLPPRLAEISLDLIDSAISWLLRRPEVAGDGVAAIGTSRGGELALLVASSCASVRAVVGFAASSVLWPGFTPGAPAPRAAWVRGGEALPFALPVTTHSTRLDGAAPLALEPLFLRGLEQAERAAKAEIHVERIQGPLLLATGGDDRMWPSRRLAESALRRRTALGASFPDRHIHYPGAGHALGRVPGLPAPSTSTVDARSGMRFALGGSRADNARAAQDLWPRVFAFLSEHLGPGSREASAERRRGCP
ncbi:acyl-CoA thioesterase/bile acid-CoA:amino acid N-acyltransferase family protein [Sorangium sp. So ce1000]|uniref:acyl-CoA thioesterase/bile acid-CoA:amino acid N-acyltransferase family protein n=1 Tax=Sorangium sp. So ce1000 TaxID=3133325 RepID=UPI003F602300